MKLYATHDGHDENNAAFLRVVNSAKYLNPFQPNPKKAPWHWQAVVDFGNDPILINFWPHVCKAQREGFRSVEGEDAMRRLIEQACEDASEPPFEVLE